MCVEILTQKAKARILIVDDHPLVRDGLMRLINSQPDLVAIGEAGTAHEAMAHVEQNQPDLAILDLRLKHGDGLELIRTLKAQEPHLLLLVLSQYDEPIYVERALRAGASGYIDKQQAANRLLEAIRTVLAGEIYLTRGMAAVLLSRGIGHAQSAGPRKEIEQLTNRELHVFSLIGAGIGTRAVAAALHVSVKTVETHRENIKHKLNLKGAAELVHAASQWASGQAILSGAA